MMHIKPPSPLPSPDQTPVVFLAGSIDMGQAEDWQTQVVAALQDIPVTVLNPRRDNWDASWKQSAQNPAFRAQVEWELDGLAQSDVIFMYLAPQSKAPISLLELGLFAATGNLIVCAAPAFWRRGNVEIVCERHHIPLLDSLDAAIQKLRAALLA